MQHFRVEHPTHTQWLEGLHCRATARAPEGRTHCAPRGRQRGTLRHHVLDALAAWHTLQCPGLATMASPTDHAATLVPPKMKIKTPAMAPRRQPRGRRDRAPSLPPPGSTVPAAGCERASPGAARRRHNAAARPVAHAPRPPPRGRGRSCARGCATPPREKHAPLPSIQSRRPGLGRDVLAEPATNLRARASVCGQTLGIETPWR